MNQTWIELIKMLMPLIVLNYMLVAFCLWLIFKKGVRNLNPWIWALIVMFVNGFGLILFLLIGRRLEHDQS